MKEEDLKVGEVYEFKAGARRITNIDYGVGKYNTYVVWEYADGVKRQGRAGGRTWKPSFAAKAKPRDESGGTYVCCWFKIEEMVLVQRAAKQIGMNVEGFMGHAVVDRANKILEIQ